MTKEEVLRSFYELSPQDREAVRQLLNQRAENDAGFERVKQKLQNLREDDGA